MLNQAATEAPIRGASLCLSSENVVAFFLLKFCKLLCNVCQLSLKGVCVCFNGFSKSGKNFHFNE